MADTQGKVKIRIRCTYNDDVVSVLVRSTANPFMAAIVALNHHIFRDPISSLAGTRVGVVFDGKAGSSV